MHFELTGRFDAKRSATKAPLTDVRGSDKKLYNPAAIQNPSRDCEGSGTIYLALKTNGLFSV